MKTKVTGVLTRTLIATAVGVILKTWQLVVCYNPSGNGLLKNTAEGKWLSLGVVLMLLWIAAEYLLFSLSQRKHALSAPVTGKLTSLAWIGVGLVMGAEGLLRLLSGFQGRKPDVIFLIASGLEIVSALVFLTEGLFSKKEGTFASLALIVPVLWSVLVLVQVTLRYPTVVAMQLPASKVILCCVAVLFLLYQVRFLCGGGSEDGMLASLFFRFASPCLLLTFSLPYGVAWLSGIRDKVQDVPYFAFIALGVYGLFALIEVFFPPKQPAVPDEEDTLA